MSKVCFDMVGHLVKKLPVWFFKYGLVTELLRKMCKGGLILSILAAYVPGNLKECSSMWVVANKLYNWT